MKQVDIYFTFLHFLQDYVKKMLKKIDETP